MTLEVTQYRFAIITNDDKRFVSPWCRSVVEASRRADIFVEQHKLDVKEFRGQTRQRVICKPKRRGKGKCNRP